MAQRVIQLSEKHRKLVKKHVERYAQLRAELAREEEFLADLEGVLCNESQQLQLNPPQILEEVAEEEDEELQEDDAAMQDSANEDSDEG